MIGTPSPSPAGCQCSQSPVTTTSAHSYIIVHFINLSYIKQQIYFNFCYFYYLPPKLGIYQVVVQRGQYFCLLDHPFSITVAGLGMTMVIFSENDRGKCLHCSMHCSYAALLWCYNSSRISQLNEYCTFLFVDCNNIKLMLQWQLKSLKSGSKAEDPFGQWIF